LPGSIIAGAIGGALSIFLSIAGARSSAAARWPSASAAALQRWHQHHGAHRSASGGSALKHRGSLGRISESEKRICLRRQPAAKRPGGMQLSAAAWLSWRGEIIVAKSGSWQPITKEEIASAEAWRKAGVLSSSNNLKRSEAAMAEKPM